MVVCPEPPAADVGAQVFAEGGNAMDAAIAVAFAQCVTNPLLCGIGGTGHLMYHDRTKRSTHVLDFEAAIGSVPVPSRWESEFQGRAETVGRYILASEANQVGHQAVMVPGFVKGCWDAYHRFGSGALAWADLLAPAIRLAREGFEVYPYIAAFWNDGTGGDATEARPGYPALQTKLDMTPGARAQYANPDGSYPQTGDWLVQADYANTLEQLATAGGDDFYRGEIARAIAADFERHEGLFTDEDLATYHANDSATLHARYRQYELVVPPPPSDGPLLIEMLKIFERVFPDGVSDQDPDFIDTFARIQRASFSDNLSLRVLAPQDFDRLIQHVTSDERADYWAERILAGDRIEVRGGTVDPGTTHATVVDSESNVVTINHSIGSIAGSGVVTPRLGFLYNNFLGHYNPLPNHDDSIVPGKRAGGGVPAILFEDGHPRIAIGAPGGSRIPTAIAETLVNVIELGHDMNTAVSNPRFHSEEAQLIYLEPANEANASALERLGNTVRINTYQARVQAIHIGADGHLDAGADPRGGAGIGRFP